MITVVVALSTFTVALAAGGICGDPYILPDLSHTNTKIVGGDIAVPYSWPWQVGLCSGESCNVYCGGSIIHYQWVLTAAHCVINKKAENLKIKAGVFDRTRNDEPGEKIIPVHAIYMHPGYNKTTKANDIAIIALKSGVQPYGRYIQPVCLPANDTFSLNAPNIWVTGWGATHEGGLSPNELRQANVPIVNSTTCQSQYTAGKIFPEIQFCAGMKGVDSCQGDSGGPAVSRFRSGPYWYQYGVVSWGTGCARERYPGVYTRVSPYCGWILKTTNKQAQCMPV